VRQEGLQETAEAVVSTRDQWLDGPLTDDTLRLLLWIHLREAFDLPARIRLSDRGLRECGDDLAAAVIGHVNPSGIKVNVRRWAARWNLAEDTPLPDTFNQVIEPVLQEILQSAIATLEELEEEEREQIEQKAREAVQERVKSLSAEEQQELARQIGSDRINDAALAKILATTGGMAAFGLSVNLAGFSAYILAAKISAFIPFMSGPAVVSWVSLLSNPITFISVTGIAAYKFTTSAAKQTAREVAIRVLAIMALQGLTAAPRDLDFLRTAFSEATTLKPEGRVKAQAVKAYQQEWQLVERCRDTESRVVDSEMERLAAIPVRDCGYRTWGEAFSETAAVGALTLGDMIYSAASIDPAVIKAADFARTEDLSGILSFADFSRRMLEKDTEAYTGVLSNLKGYTAEVIVADQLVAQGHQVSFPETSNQAGWDLMVDGQEFQVKNLSSVAGLHEHFEKYDYPVIANSELMGQIPEHLADRVYFVSGYSDETVTHLTSESLEAGAEMFDPDVPVFALGVSVYRYTMQYRNGRIGLSQAAEQVIAEGTTRASLAVAGGFLGKTVGLLVFGPAGALVLGGSLPVLAQAQHRTVTGLCKNLGGIRYRHWRDRTEEAMERLASKLKEALASKIELVQRRRQSVSRDGFFARFVKARWVDDSVHLREQQALLDRILEKKSKNIDRRAHKIIAWTGKSTIHPVHYQKELLTFNEVYQQKPGQVSQAGDVVGERYKAAKTWVNEKLEKAKRSNPRT
jgi:hypothetical protein